MVFYSSSVIKELINYSSLDICTIKIICLYLRILKLIDLMLNDVILWSCDWKCFENGCNVEHFKKGKV